MKKNSGYTLLFAMIVASIVLALGVSLLTISRKEFALSSSATQSTNAFYAADSGIDCAEYWDSSSSINFSTSSSDKLASTTCSYNDTTAPHTVTLTGPFPPTYPDELPNSSTYTFTFYTPFSTDGTSNKSCAAVTVDKYYVTDPSVGLYIRTAITSRGYNIGWNPPPTKGTGAGTGDCSSPSPKKVERAIQVTY